MYHIFMLTVDSNSMDTAYVSYLCSLFTVIAWIQPMYHIFMLTVHSNSMDTAYVYWCITDVYADCSESGGIITAYVS